MVNWYIMALPYFGVNEFSLMSKSMVNYYVGMLFPDLKCLVFLIIIWYGRGTIVLLEKAKGAN